MQIGKIKQPPPYHLRHNKAVDRFLLVELLKRLDRVEHDFTENACYCGFGGPYLEDIRLIHENFPKMRLCSVEIDQSVLDRQKFLAPCKGIELIPGDYKSIFDKHSDIFDSNAVVWLDYIGFEPRVIEDFTTTINTFQRTSVLRVTVEADYEKYKRKKYKGDSKSNPFDKFRENFGDFFPASMDNEPKDDNEFVGLVREILLKAAYQVLPTSSGSAFVPIMSTFYSDSTIMYSLTGIVYVTKNPLSLAEVRDRVNSSLSQWDFANELKCEDKTPIIIDLPYLTTKERLHLQKFLPCNEKDDPGEILFKELKYAITTKLETQTQNENDEQTKNLLRSYAKFYRYYPYVIRGNP